MSYHYKVVCSPRENRYPLKGVGKVYKPKDLKNNMKKDELFNDTLKVAREIYKLDKKNVSYSDMQKINKKFKKDLKILREYI